jgi:hypothetical protein
MNCAHAGRCREEGLLLALLEGKRGLDYGYKEVAELPKIRRRKVARVSKEIAQKEAVS